MAEATTSNQQRPQIVIKTPRLILRGAKPTDSKGLFECFSDAQTMLYWDTLPHASIDKTQNWVDKMIQGENNGVTDFVICLKPSLHTGSVVADDTGAESDASEMEIIGKVGIWQGDEIGFLINRRYWGMGLALEAVGVVLDLAFWCGEYEVQDFNVNTVERRDEVVADVDPRNAASLGILKKLGFEIYATKERTFQVGDVWVDSVYLSLRREVWIEVRERLGRRKE